MILYIDTSSSYLYTGIVNNDKLICQIKKKFDTDLSKEALARIVTMLEGNNIKANDIHKIIVVNGPGSFTGIRIGITIAKTYAWSLNIPIIEISGLEAMAISTYENKYLVPVIDARREYVYGAIYDKDKICVYSPKHIKIEELEEQFLEFKDYIIVTNDEVNINGQKVNYDPDIFKIVEATKDRKTSNPHTVNPNYLKLTEAEEKINV